MALTKGRSAGEDAGASAAASRFGGGAAGGSSGGTGKVFMGRYLTEGAGPGGRPGKVLLDRTMSVEEAKLDFRTWSEKKQQDFLAKLKLSGLTPADAGPMEAGKVWEGLVDEAAKYAAAKKNKISPMDILAMYVKNAGGSQWVRQGDFEVNTATHERRYVGPQFKTTTQTRIDMSDPATARAVATKMFQDLMGRNPGRGEIGTFATALAQAERDNPLTETTTTEYRMGASDLDPVSSTSVTSGGVSADAKALLAEDQIKADPEYGAVQASTTYMNAFENAVYGAPE